jgi:arylsulfatase
MSVNPFDPHPPLDPPAEYLERMDVEHMPLPLFGPEDAERQRTFGRVVAHQTREPHHPDSYNARLMVAAYYAQIELIDDQVGRILRALDESGQRENTIVIFTSDHGEMLGDHGLKLKGCRFYEGAVHVPLIISWPVHFRAGLVSDALVELVDLAPTLYEATRVPMPADVQGLSLLPILTGEADPGQHKPFVRCEYHDALGQALASHADMIFDGRYKLAVYHGTGLGELYDLAEDPSEFNNLWDVRGADALRCRLMAALFGAVSSTTDVGTPRVGSY